MVVTWQDVDDALWKSGRRKYAARLVRDTDGARRMEFTCGQHVLDVPADRALDLFEHEQAERFCRAVGVNRRFGAPLQRGELRSDCVPALVLEALASEPRKFWARYEVVQRISAGGRRFVGWALWRAQQNGWVETADDARNERYQRYRITADGLRRIGREE